MAEGLASVRSRIIEWSSGSVRQTSFSISSSENVGSEDMVRSMSRGEWHGVGDEEI